MLQVVLQTLTRGNADLVRNQLPLNAVSSWLESEKSVSVDDAPRFETKKIIKTHLPVSLAPYTSDAKYIYVTRNPASCFASCVDFLRSNLSGYRISMEECEEWFCSDQMWWGSWPAHVASWCKMAKNASNILIVRFEDMKHDLPSVVSTVAKFLHVELPTDAQMARIIEKCSFDYMRTNADVFEIYPPHLLRLSDHFFVRGTAQRYRDLPADVRERILTWCRSQISATDIDESIAALYPELMAKKIRPGVASYIPN